MHKSNSFRRIIVLSLFVLALPLCLNAQVADTASAESKPAVERVPLLTRDYYAQQGVDTLHIAHSDALKTFLASSAATLPEKAEVCEVYAKQLEKVQQTLASNGTLVDGILWIDEVVHYIDYDFYNKKVVLAIATCKELATQYKVEERQRIERERKAARDKAAKEAREKQERLDNELWLLRDQITDFHSQIEAICLNPAAEKNRQKILKDIRYSYLPIFNKYDTSPTKGSEEVNANLGELRDFQRLLLDSILGSNGYPMQIDAFANTLKNAAGKSHSDVFKSYQKAFKKVANPSTFSSLADFNTFLTRYRETYKVQQLYLEVISLRETIAVKSIDVKAQCGKQHKDVYNSYSEILESIDQIPTFVTLNEADPFISQLKEFNKVQDEYINSVNRLEVIARRGDSIIAICDKKLSDISSAYKEMLGSVSHVPNFKTVAGAEFFYKSLDDFEQMQRDYIIVVDRRRTIASKNDSILASKNSPKGLAKAYKELQSRVVLSPSFPSHSQALDFIDRLNANIELQNKFLQVQTNFAQIATNGQEIKNLSKSASNIGKAYNLIFKNTDLSVLIVTDADVDRYLVSQNDCLHMQETFINVLKSYNREVYNNALKGEKDLGRIRTTMGL